MLLTELERVGLLNLHNTVEWGDGFGEDVVSTQHVFDGYPVFADEKQQTVLQSWLLSIKRNVALNKTFDTGRTSNHNTNCSID